MKQLMLHLRRFILKRRIDFLRADIACAEERYEAAELSADSAGLYLDDAHRRLRALRAHLAMIERPDVLLAQALQGPHE